MVKIRFILSLLIFSFFFSCIENKKNDSYTSPETQNKGPYGKTVSQGSQNNSSDTNSQFASADISTEGNLSVFYRQMSKKPQRFSINTGKDTIIICAEKTTLNIKANSFVSAKTKKEMTGTIQLSVKEYYSVTDILLAKLSTTADGQLLETGGMLQITARSGDEECELKNGKSIEIGFPRKTEKEGMRLFTGRWNAQNEINWTLDKNSVDLNQIFSNPEVMAQYPGGNVRLFQFLNRNIIVPESVEKSGKILVHFVVDREGNITKEKVIRGISPEADKAVLDALKKAEKFEPGKIKGVAVATSFTLPLTIDINEVSDNTSSNNQRYSKKTEARIFEKKYNDNNLAQAGVNRINYYLLNSTKLGMINCDRFWKTNSVKIDFALNLNTTDEASVNIVFHSYRSILTQTTGNGKSLFKDIPSGEKVTVIAIKYVNDKPYLAVQETSTSVKDLTSVAFEPVTIDRLKKEIGKLDQLY